jgi:hypothetical protein
MKKIKAWAVYWKEEGCIDVFDGKTYGVFFNRNDAIEANKLYGGGFQTVVPVEIHIVATMNEPQSEIEKWEERLFLSKIGALLHSVFTSAEEKMLKDFIRTEIEAAKRQERDEIVGIAKELLGRRNFPGGNPTPEYDKGIDDVIKEITSRNQNLTPHKE